MRNESIQIFHIYFRRKEQTFYWQSNNFLSQSIKNQNLKTVKHLTLGGKQAVYKSADYHPNVFELPVQDYPRGYFGSMLTTLGHILSLKQLKKLNIDCDDFPVHQLLTLLSLTPNVRSSK